MSFKVGDKVKRVGDSWNHVKQGHVYTISWCVDGTNSIALVEIAGNYEKTKFKLFTRQFPKTELEWLDRVKENFSV